MPPSTLSGRAARLILELGLVAHPEGGYYREIYRSPRRVSPLSQPSGSGTTTERSAMTCIYFLLPVGHRSRWHRTGADETWHLLEGDPLELLCFDPTRDALARWRLGPVGAGTEPTRIVPAGCWQAARPLGDYALVACTVSPGFEFADFELAADLPTEARRLATLLPDSADLL